MQLPVIVILEVSIDFILNVLSDYIVFRNATVTGWCHLTITTSRYNESIFFFLARTNIQSFQSQFPYYLVSGTTRCNDFSLTARESTSHLSSHTVKWFSILLKRRTVLIELFMAQKKSLTNQLMSVAEFDMWRIMQIETNVIQCEVEPGREG